MAACGLAGAMAGVTRRATVAAVLLVAAPAVAGPPPAAQMYRWLDDRGNPHYSQGLDSVPERFRAKATRPLYRDEPAPVSGSTAAGESGETVILFTPGERIYADARINGGTSLRLILDTGARRTVIAPSALAAAGVLTRTAEVAGKARSGAGGSGIETYEIDSLQVGNARVGKMQVISRDIEEFGTDGLLGRDFLDQFKVTIDNDVGRVTLAPKCPDTVSGSSR